MAGQDLPTGRIAQQDIIVEQVVKVLIQYYGSVGRIRDINDVVEDIPSVALITARAGLDRSELTVECSAIEVKPAVTFPLRTVPALKVRVALVPSIRS